MPADLRFNGFVQRSSMVVLGDHIAILEHDWSQDRVRRITHERIESVLMWRRVLWGHIVLLLLVFGGLGGWLVSYDIYAVRVVGVVLLSVLIVAVARYLYLGKTTIRINRSDKAMDFTGIISPRRVERCLARIETFVRQVQDQKMDQEAEVEPEAVRADEDDQAEGLETLMER